MKMDNTFFLIGRIKEHYTAFLEDELKRIGMRSFVTSHADILAVLRIYGELTLSEVADKINRDRSTVTALVAKLNKQKYVQQRINESDKRSSFLSLTEKGKGLVPEFLSIGNALLKKATEGISEEEWSDFRKTLEKVYGNFI
jgi:MarR family transcriptional regulator, organic hydroperoxide resistance regulator